MIEGYDDLRLRPAERSDAEALTDLHLDCWDDAYTGIVPQHVIDARRANRSARIVQWGGWMQRSPTLLAEDGSGLVGFATWGEPRDDDWDDWDAWDGPALELMSLYTRARVWGTGVGAALLTAALGDHPAYLWVLAGNPRAIRFYEKHGFRLDGTRKDCIEGVDARMVRAVQAQAHAPAQAQ